MALVSDTTKYDELLRSSEDEDEMMAPAAAPAAEKEYKCKDMIMALIFLSGVAAMVAGLAANVDGDPPKVLSSLFSPSLETPPFLGQALRRSGKMRSLASETSSPPSLPPRYRSQLRLVSMVCTFFARCRQFGGEQGERAQEWEGKRN